MAIPNLTQEQNNTSDSTSGSAKDATAEVFLLAFKSLPDEYQQAVLRRLLATTPEQKQPAAQVLAAIARDRWTPPAGSPDSLILLREDRAR